MPTKTSWVVAVGALGLTAVVRAQDPGQALESSAAPGSAATPVPAAQADAVEHHAADTPGGEPIMSDAEADYLAAMSLDELLQTATSVGAIGSRPLRAQAGVISVITRREIAETSARDLEEILVMQVPGFSPGADVTGVTGLGLRGFFGYVGQFVVFIDGLDMTDALFGVFATGAHIPAEQIEKIEIIRGPGSVSYGGNAELAVIRVTTVGADMEGVTANTTLGTSGDGTLAHRYGVAGGMHFGEDGHVRLSASLGRNYRSDRTYLGGDGRSVDLANRSDIDTLMVSGGVRYKGLAFDAVYDHYRLEDWTFYGEPLDGPSYQDFKVGSTALAYSWQATEWLTLTPKVIYNLQRPWMASGPGLTLAGESRYEVQTQRATGELTAVAQVNDSSRLMLGVEVYDERARQVSRPDRLQGRDLAERDFQSVAAFGQYELDSDIVKLTLGGRFQHHSYAGNAFVPRAAATKAWKRFHTKLMYGRSFRTPQIEMINLAVGKPITPEYATAYEVEAGYQFTYFLSLVSNAFYQQVQDILIYGTTSAGEETYKNSDELSTVGVETQLRARDKWGNVAVTHSYYRPVENTEREVYGSGDKTLNLAFPAHKITLNAEFPVAFGLSLGTAALFTTTRRGYPAESLGEQVADFGPLFVADLFANYRFKLLSLGLGVKNVLDERVDYIQPFNGFAPPLPDKSREYYLSMSVNFDADDSARATAPYTGFRAMPRPSL